jgi:competence protein ComEA
MAVVLEHQRIRLALAAVAAFAVVFGGVRLLERARAGPSPGSERVSVDAGGSPPSPASGPGSGSGSAAGARLYVDVAGEVHRPGLYRVARGSRVAVAIGMAGGFTRRAETTQVNLAAPVQDGQQVIVPPRGPVAAAGPVGLGGAGSRPVSLSTATADDLDSLDGIGPTLAQRIVEYRQAHGGFRSIDELRQVDGIGDKRFQQLKKALQP